MAALQMVQQQDIVYMMEQLPIKRSSILNEDEGGDGGEVQSRFSADAACKMQSWMKEVLQKSLYSPPSTP